MTPEALMRIALREAEKGRGRTHPNPAVGALVVRNGRIIARGHHQKAGGPHAEVLALRRAGPKARGDDPLLTVRGVPNGRNPLGVLLGMPPPKARLLRQPGETIVAKGPIKNVLRDLARRGLTSVLVEGGANVHGQFLARGLWDEL